MCYFSLLPERSSYFLASSLEGNTKRSPSKTSQSIATSGGENLVKKEKKHLLNSNVNIHAHLHVHIEYIYMYIVHIVPVK